MNAGSEEYIQDEPTHENIDENKLSWKD
jgi:hypothetical protein